MRSVLTPIVTIFGLDLAACSAARSSPRPSSASRHRRLSIDAVGEKDLPIILGVTMFGAFFIVSQNGRRPALRRDRPAGAARMTFRRPPARSENGIPGKD